MKESVFVFDTNNELNYWFKHIVECFRENIKVNNCSKIIESNDTKWYFIHKVNLKKFMIGRKNINILLHAGETFERLENEND